MQAADRPLALFSIRSARVSSLPSEREPYPLLTPRVGEGPAPRRWPQNAAPPTRYARSTPQQESHRPHCAHIGRGREAGARKGATAAGGGQTRDKRAVSIRAAERACEATQASKCNFFMGETRTNHRAAASKRTVILPGYGGGPRI